MTAKPLEEFFEWQPLKRLERKTGKFRGWEVSIDGAKYFTFAHTRSRARIRVVLSRAQKNDYGWGRPVKDVLKAVDYVRRAPHIDPLAERILSGNTLYRDYYSCYSPTMIEIRLKELQLNSMEEKKSVGRFDFLKETVFTRENINIYKSLLVDCVNPTVEGKK